MCNIIIIMFIKFQFLLPHNFFFQFQNEIDQPFIGWSRNQWKCGSVRRNRSRLHCSCTRWSISLLFSTNGKRLFYLILYPLYFIILGTAFEIEYQVLEGGDLDIDFQMSSPSGTLLFNELRSEEGLHEIASAEEGDYKVKYLVLLLEIRSGLRTLDIDIINLIFQICFNNNFSRITDKTVFWEVFVEDDYDYDDYDDEYDDYDDDEIAEAKKWRDDLRKLQIIT